MILQIVESGWNQGNIVQSRNQHALFPLKSPAPRRKHATLPVVKVITPKASLSGLKESRRGQIINYGQWKKRAGWRWSNGKNA